MSGSGSSGKKLVALGFGGALIAGLATVVYPLMISKDAGQRMVEMEKDGEAFSKMMNVKQSGDKSGDK
jgi:hypothetical protein